MSQALAPARLTTVQWLICVIAAIGFAFDIYELLMLPLILRPALVELTGFQPGTPGFIWWAGMMFYVPAFAGGIFGLLGGYLTDRLGRRFVLTWSILLYAVSAFAAGFSTSPLMLLILRSTTFIGVCIEFVAAVAWLAELFPHEKQRESVLGYTQAFSSIGGLLVAVANGLAVSYAVKLPAILMPSFLVSLLGQIAPDHQHEAWRYTLMSGLIPAIPLILIRPFLPESPVWAQKRAAGTLKRPSIGQLFSPELRQTTIVTTIMFACSYGAAFGAIQQMPQIAPGLPEVKAATAGKPVPQQKQIEQKAASDYTKVQEIGGLIGRFLLALLAVRIVSRRGLLRLFQIPGIFLMPLIFWYAGKSNPLLFTIGGHSYYALHAGIFIAGLLTVAQFSFWGNYLPRVYPVHLRGTGESFAANIGGRMIGTSFAYLAFWLSSQSFIPGGSPGVKMANTAAILSCTVYVVGSIACFWLPEPKEEAIAD
ncbi:MAG: MFS transporter [Planctomycetales bacterium]